MVLIAYAHQPPIKAQVDVSSGARGLNFGLSLRLPQLFGNDVYIRFQWYHILCMRAAKVMASLRICTDWPEPSLLGDAISTKISSQRIFFK